MSGLFQSIGARLLLTLVQKMHCFFVRCLTSYIVAQAVDTAEATTRVADFQRWPTGGGVPRRKEKSKT
jgi:hypothetical protein